MDFSLKYNRQDFIEFFTNQLLPEDFLHDSQIIDLDFSSKYYQQVAFLGNCPSLDLNIYEVKHSSEHDPRVSLSRDAFKLISRYDSNNALILFVPGNGNQFRLSLVTIHPKLDEKGIKIKREYSNPKRFSFLLGEGSKINTPTQFLIQRGRIADFEDLKSRFSVEVVNKEFYTMIAEQFSKLVGGKRKKGNMTVTFDRQLELPSVSSENDQKFKEFAVRLIGRTIFCWFLKMKKSKNGLPLIDNDVLSSFAVGFNPNYYHEKVEPLFFEVLNNQIQDRKEKYKQAPYDITPFLNGGLFEPHPDDFYEVNSRTDFSYHINTLKVPDQWWIEFLSILESYNFTIDENTSIDIDLSVDPEMLGRVFENLLAEINPETGESARKATGSYYTPRAIVDFIVDNSLIISLSANTGISTQKLEILLDYTTEESNLALEEERRVIEAINSLKIIDPACGSGAFPMGILQKLLLILQKIDRGAENSIESILEDIKDPIKKSLLANKLKAARVEEDSDLDDYARKLSVIQKSIYGIDIQPIATELSKLRVFLSLIVDEDIQDNFPNRGIEPLPNLEFKFVSSNILISLYKNNVETSLFEDQDNISELSRIREEYFVSYGDKKNQLKESFSKVQERMFKTFIRNYSAFSEDSSSTTSGLIDWNPFSDSATNWFDPKWMFGVEDGFDIVIGNPPYIAFQRMNIDSKEQIQKQKFDTFEYTGDIYSVFYERGQQLLKEHGVLCYITSRQWMHSSYGKSLRRFFADKTDPVHLIDFGQVKIFDGATVFVNILLFRNSKNSNSLEACLLPLDYSIENGNLSSYFNSAKHTLSNISEGTWIVSDHSKINDQIEETGIPLSEWSDLEFFRGITSGYNEAFHIDESTMRQIVDLDGNNRNVIKPLLRGKDIKRYSYTYANLYTLFIPWHFPLHENKSISSSSGEAEDAFKKLYPAIYKHLEKYKDRLSKRNKAETGIRYEWYALQRYGADFWENYEKPKIVWIEISDRANYALDEKGMYLTNSAYFLTCNNENISLKFILAVLNSKISDFYFSQKTAKIAGGRMRYTKQYVEQIPIPKISREEQHPFTFLVTCILLLHENTQIDSSFRKMVYLFENVIDVAVAELYFKDAVYKAGFKILSDLNHEIGKLKGISIESISTLYKSFNSPQNSIGQAVKSLRKIEPFKTIEDVLDKKSK